jgi:hypothetical protein
VYTTHVDTSPTVPARNIFDCFCYYSFQTRYLLEDLKLLILDKDKKGQTPFDVATGKCRTFLEDRKEKGYLSGSAVDRGGPKKDNKRS